MNEQVGVVLVVDELDEASCAYARQLACDLKDLGPQFAGLFLLGVAGPETSGLKTIEGVTFRPVGDTGASLVEAVNGLIEEDRCDLVLVRDGIRIDRATLVEMRRIASLDPMIAAVSPRFERDSLYAFPRFPHRPADDRDQRQVTDLLRRQLREVSYVPVPDSRCVYLKHGLLSEFGPLALRDDLETALVDFAFRINRYGFRAALANWVRATCGSGHESERAPEHAGPSLLDGLHPAYSRFVGRFLRTPEVQAEHILSGLLPDASGRLDVAFDFTSFELRHAGTVVLARELLAEAARTWTNRFNVHVVCRPDVYDFHLRGLPVGIQRVDPEDPRSFAALIRIGQPFSWTHLKHAVVRAPALIVFMLDTIALDCMHLATDDLYGIWQFTLRSADAVLYNSEFTRAQYEFRFAIPDAVDQSVSLHSLNPGEYAANTTAPEKEPANLLVVGNAFHHKYVEETIDVLARHLPNEAIVALGLGQSGRPNVVCYPSGSLEQHEIDALYAGARLVIYPTLYEGFGFPLLEAIAHKKPVLARPLPPFLEIAGQSAHARNIHFFQGQAELLDLLRSNITWREAPDPSRPVRRWADSCSDLERAVGSAIENAAFGRVVDRLDVIGSHFGHVRSSTDLRGSNVTAWRRADEIDRAATAAGRLAQDLVYRLGNTAAGFRFLTGLIGRLRAARKR